MTAYVISLLITLAIISSSLMIKNLHSDKPNSRLLYNVFVLITVLSIGTAIHFFDTFILT